MTETMYENAAMADDGRLKLDYTLETPEARNELVKKIIAETPPEKLSKRYISILTDYIVFAMDNPSNIIKAVKGEKIGTLVK